MKQTSPNTATFAFAHAPHLPIVGELHPLRAQYHPLLYRALGFALFVHLAGFGGILIASLTRPAPPPERTIVVQWDHFPTPAPLDDARTGRRPADAIPCVTKPTFAVPEPVPDFRADKDVVFGAPEDLAPSPLDGGVDGDGNTTIVVDIPPAAPGGELKPTTLELCEEMPVLISMPAPAYPELARQAGVEGTVTVRALVGRDGEVHEIFIVSGIAMLDEAAMAAARAAVFKPALQQHRPVAVWVLIPMQFMLH